jgi:hypothetical protein
MYEKRLKDLSSKIGIKEQKKFYILTHKKHHREIYFQNNSKAIDFLMFKLNDSSSRKFRRIKKVLYILIKLRLIQPFLRKINLSARFGDAILVGEKVNCFDLEKKEVLSFQLRKELEGEFIRSKKFQKKMASRGFASKIYEKIIIGFSRS